MLLFEKLFSLQNYLTKLRYAKNYSGVSLDSFVKKITFQKVTKEGVLNIGKAIELMAEAEGLQAHKNAISIRLKDLDKANLIELKNKNRY